MLIACMHGSWTSARSATEILINDDTFGMWCEESIVIQRSRAREFTHPEIMPFYFCFYLVWSCGGRRVFQYRAVVDRRNELSPAWLITWKKHESPSIFDDYGIWVSRRPPRATAPRKRIFDRNTYITCNILQTYYGFVKYLDAVCCTD